VTVADYPPAVLAAAEKAIIEAATDFGHDDLVAGSFREFARAALEAAAPLLAEAWGVKPPPSALELERSAARARARSVACPLCGSAAGEMCRTVESRGLARAGYTLSAIHAARKWAALAAGDIPEVPREAEEDKGS